MTRLDHAWQQRHPSVPPVIVHRADLQHLLLDAAAGIPMRLHAPARRVSTANGAGVVELANGERLLADVVLGCDGVHSIARAVVNNSQPRYRGLTTWRAVLDDSACLVSDGWLTIGDGKQFIASSLRRGATYWAAALRMPAGENEALADKRRLLQEAFQAGMTRSEN